MHPSTPPRAALVTGASTGIGHAIARALLQDGYGVTICARTPDKLDEAAHDLQEHGSVSSVVADVTVADDVQRLVGEHQARFGRLDVLINNAGVMRPGPMSVAPVDSLDAHVSANLRSVWMVTTAALPLLREAGAEHGEGLVVTTASIVGKYAQPAVPAYSATKAALFALSQSLQQELSTSGVRVTTLAPAFVDTPMTSGLPLAPEDLITPSDVGEAVRFLTRVSRNCAVPEIQLLRPTDRLLAAL